MSGEPSNTERALRAQQAIGAYPTDMDPENALEIDCIISDLITDLLHLARLEGFSPGLVHGRSWDNFEEEHNEEEDPS